MFETPQFQDYLTSSTVKYSILPINSFQEYPQIREKKAFFRDNTGFIEIVEHFHISEALQALTFYRPPRFGKTLFLSTLESFYDINQSELWDFLFKVVKCEKVLKLHAGNKHLQNHL